MTFPTAGSPDPYRALWRRRWLTVFRQDFQCNFGNRWA